MKFCIFKMVILKIRSCVLHNVYAILYNSMAIENLYNVNVFFHDYQVSYDARTVS